MATKADIVIDQGTTFSTTLTLTDENGDLLNLSGYQANAQMRKWYTSTTATNFTTSINTTSSVITLSLSLGCKTLVHPFPNRSSVGSPTNLA